MKEYRNETGNCFVPERYYPELSHWVNAQRARKRDDKMSLERERKLDEIGFPWINSFEQSWGDNIGQLRQFIVRHGHSKIPREHPLFGWFGRMQTQYFKDELDPEKQKDIQAVPGFEWAPSLEERWDKRLATWNKYVRFRRKTAPRDMSEKQRRKAGCIRTWANAQRNLHRNGSLSKKRIKKLVTAGFDWGEESVLPVLEEENARRKRKRDSSSSERKRPEKKSKEIVEGSRVAVYWPEDDKYYKGFVRKQRSNGDLFVLYDDNDTEWVSPKESKIKQLEEQHIVRETGNPPSDLQRKRVSVYWPREEEYYEGVVAKQKSNGDFFVEYDDGDSEWLCLNTKDFIVLDPPTESACDQTKPSSSAMKLTTGAQESIWQHSKRKYFDATVVDLKNSRKTPHKIKHSNGDLEWTNLHKCKFKLVSVPIRGAGRQIVGAIYADANGTSASSDEAQGEVSPASVLVDPDDGETEFLL